MQKMRAVKVNSLAMHIDLIKRIPTEVRTALNHMHIDARICELTSDHATGKAGPDDKDPWCQLR